MIIFEYTEIYNRVRSGRPYCEKLVPYSKQQLLRTLRFLENEEEFEKCKLLKDIIDNRFNHEIGFRTPIY